jgi:hypothetical protein
MTTQQRQVLDYYMELIEVYLSQVANLVSCLDTEDYQGGEFCSGLIFGANGARLLTKMAEKAIEFVQNTEHQIKQLKSLV